MSHTTERRRARDAIPARPDPRTAPLSFIQRQMWLIDQLAPGNPAYNLARGLRLRGRVDVAALEAAFNAVIRRHEILRTTFAAQDGEPLQLVHPELTIRIPVTPLEQFPPEAREGRARSLATAESLRPFDLARLPLVRAALLTLGASEHVLIVSVHHIAADGLSIDLLLDEVGAACRAFATGVEPEFPALPLQYGDFAHWQRDAWADDAPHAPAIDYWRRHLRGALPVLELAGDRPRPAARSYRGSNVFFRLPADVSDGVRALAMRERCTSFMVLLAAFQLLLARYASTVDVVIGVPLGAREREELQPLIGNFLTMAGVRGDLSGEPSFLDLLRRARDATLDALTNAVPLEVVMRQLAIERVAGRDPVFQVLFEMHGTGVPQIGDLDVAPFDFDFGLAQFDMSLHVHDEADAYPARIEYSTDLFDRESAERMAAAFTELVRHAVAQPEQPAMELPVLPAAERQRILGASVGRAVQVAGLPVHARIAAQAARTPERIAVRCGSTELTYEELEARVARVARALRERGARRGERIGVCVERNGDLIVALLGVLHTGAAYVPLDPAYPAPRLRRTAEDARLALLVSTEPLAGWCALPRERQLLLDADRCEISAASAATPDTHELPRASDPAYLIYTSGSTGTPKGVIVPHGAVANLLASMAEEPGIAADDILLAVTTVSFDIAVLELFLPLCAGATVILATRDEVRDGDAMRSLLDRHRVTMMQATPVTWRLLLEAGWKGNPRFKALVGGEPLPQTLADALLASGTELWNMYGPTETTVWSTCARISGTSAGITIGRPIANTVVRVLDARRRLCPTGVPGELYVGGAGLALGYWNRPELTAERFVADPEDASGAMLYRTGDRVRLRSDGSLEHLGRLDDQVKLRGFRIELHEVEANVAGHPGVRDAAVAIRCDSQGDAYLAAYLAVEHGGTASSATEVVDGVRAHLRAELPEFMVPTRYVVLEKLPRTANGKLDRRALPDPDPDTRVDSAPAAPRTAMEAMVLEIFRDVLRRPSVGAHDNFFELGGDSLMAARLMLRLRAACGFNVPLGLLFERQTAAGLAEAVESLASAAPPARAAAAASPLAAIVPIQPRGDAPPIFGVPGHNGDVFCFRALARHLGDDQPLYGLQPPGLDGHARPLERIEDLAAFFEQQIRAFKPRGPIVIAGNCAGCVTAFELGRRLHEAGMAVDSVALFGAPFAARFQRVPRLLDDAEAWISEQARRAVTHASAFLSRHPARWGAYVAEKMALVRAQRAAAQAAAPDPVRSLRQAVERATLEAARHYRPRRFGGRLRLFVASRAALGTRDHPLHWRAFARESEVWFGPIGCRADNMLREPHAKDFAEAFRRGAKAADSPTPVPPPLLQAPRLTIRSRT